MTYFTAGAGVGRIKNETKGENANGKAEAQGVPLE